jgi:hypothetical protein
MFSHLNFCRSLFSLVTQQEKDEELYCASLLALFKPWRVLGDLHVLGISFSASLVSFLASADNKVGDLVGNIKYSYNMGC